jgi:hypothetical protein
VHSVSIRGGQPAALLRHQNPYEIIGPGPAMTLRDWSALRVIGTSIAWIVLVALIEVLLLMGSCFLKMDATGRELGVGISIGTHSISVRTYC